MRYTEFNLKEGYKEVQQKFSQEADPTEVASAFDVFKKLVSANRIKGNERNIDWWGKQGWSAFAEYVTAIDERPSEAEQKARKGKGESHVLEETAEWFIVVPLDKDASCFYGKKSDWCTTKPTQSNFEDYFLDNSITLIYFFRQSDGAMWAMAVSPENSAEYFDQSDQSLSSAQFDKQTGLNSKKYIQIVGGETDAGQKATASRDSMKADLKTLQDYIEKLEQMSAPRRSAKVETLLLKVKDQELIKEYFEILHRVNGPVEVDQQLQTLVATNARSAINFLKGVTAKTIRIVQKKETNRPRPLIDIRYPSKEAVSYIATVGELALPYAINVIEGEWPPGEAAIATDGKMAYQYARYIIRGEWPPGEAAIAEDHKSALVYAMEVIKGPWPPGEPAILTDAKSIMIYAVEVLKGQWPEGEKVMAKDYRSAYRYAVEVLEGPFPAAEETIASNGYYAYRYAIDVLKDRWPEGEEAMKEFWNDTLWTKYVKFVNGEIVKPYTL